MLRISYGCFESGVRGQNFEPIKTLAPNSRLTQELQEVKEVTTDYKIQLSTSRTDYVSATNPKILSIRGHSGRNVIDRGKESRQRVESEKSPMILKFGVYRQRLNVYKIL